ncbi:Hypothetical predicted protein, partial [Pelobates cultripes]
YYDCKAAVKKKMLSQSTVGFSEWQTWLKDGLLSEAVPGLGAVDTEEPAVQQRA